MKNANDLKRTGIGPDTEAIRKIIKHTSYRNASAKIQGWGSERQCRVRQIKALCGLESRFCARIFSSIHHYTYAELPYMDFMFVAAQRNGSQATHIFYMFEPFSNAEISYLNITTYESRLIFLRSFIQLNACRQAQHWSNDECCPKSFDSNTRNAFIHWT